MPSGFLCGLPGEICVPTKTARRTFFGKAMPSSFTSSSAPGSSPAAVPENR